MAARTHAGPGPLAFARAFWCWWMSELGAVMQTRLGPRLRYESWPLTRPPARSDTPLDLLLGSGVALEKIFTLPIRAEARLKDLLRHEIARQFPFSATDCVFAWEVLGRVPETGRMQVRMAALPHADLAGIERSLFAQGRKRGTVAIAAQAGSRPLVLARAHETDTWSRTDRALGLLAALALIAALAMPYWQEVRRIDALRARIDMPRLGERMSAQARARALARIEALYPEHSIIVLIEELAKALPDNAWVNHLRLGDGEVEIEGTAENAARLVPLLEAVPSVAAVSFAAPTVTEPALGLERFRLRLSLGGGAP